MIYNNFMFSIQRLANFNRDIVVQGAGMGMLPTICNITNDMGGVAENNLQNKPWDNVEIGWLSILGYEAYLINPIDNNQWEPAVDFNDGTLSITETGTTDQYTISWASNINNQWYIGLNLNIPTLSYTKRTSHYETSRSNSAELKSMYHLSGLGVSGSIGLIYRPLQALRIGASFQTPTMMSLSVQTEGDMYSTVDGQKYEILTPESGVQTVEMVSPLKFPIEQCLDAWSWHWGNYKRFSPSVPSRAISFCCIMLHEKAACNSAQTTPSMHLWVCRSAGIGSRLWVCSTGLILWYRLRFLFFSWWRSEASRGLGAELTHTHTYTHTHAVDGI
jgi:hypothetical protein